MLKHPPCKKTGQTAHDSNHKARIGPRRRPVGLENGHVPAAVLVAADGVAGIKGGHAVAHPGECGVLVWWRGDNGRIGGWNASWGWPLLLL